MDSYVAVAEAIARDAHAAQVDKAGNPYIGHVARVAARVAGADDAVATAWLHDVIEDTNFTAEELRTRGIPDMVVDAVVLLTRVEGQDPEAYYSAVAANALARAVKLADIADNSDPERLAKLNTAAADRLRAKYAHARAALG
jgi:(p)ppGpp synthase/HD superfamily hydrolase